MAGIKVKSKLIRKSYKWGCIRYFSFSGMISTSCCIYPRKIIYENIFVIKIKKTIWRIADYSKPQPDFNAII